MRDLHVLNGFFNSFSNRNGSGCRSGIRGESSWRADLFRRLTEPGELGCWQLRHHRSLTNLAQGTRKQMTSTVEVKRIRRGQAAGRAHFTSATPSKETSE